MIYLKHLRLLVLSNLVDLDLLDGKVRVHRSGLLYSLGQGLVMIYRISVRLNCHLKKHKNCSNTNFLSVHFKLDLSFKIPDSYGLKGESIGFAELIFPNNRFKRYLLKKNKVFLWVLISVYLNGDLVSE